MSTSLCRGRTTSKRTEFILSSLLDRRWGNSIPPISTMLFHASASSPPLVLLLTLTVLQPTSGQEKTCSETNHSLSPSPPPARLSRAPVAPRFPPSPR
eukprot:750701-Hanusia_phi.AAC.5